MFSISLIKSSEFSEEIYKDYSRFKHGSKSIARKFGRQLAQKISDECVFCDKESLVFYPAPYLNIPTASSALKDYLLSYLSRDFLEKN